MLVRVVRAPLCPGQREVAIARYEQEGVPVLQAQVGFAGALLLTDRATQQAISLTFWDETTMEVDPALFRRQLAAFEPLIAGAFAVELYEVSAATPLPLALLANHISLDRVPSRQIDRATRAQPIGTSHTSTADRHEPHEHSPHRSSAGRRQLEEVTAMPTVEQRADGWFIVVQEGQQVVGACFSDRQTAQLIADTLPARPAATGARTRSAARPTLPPTSSAVTRGAHAAMTQLARGPRAHSARG